MAPKGIQTEKWELYNLEKDRYELNNLASSLPEKVRAMSAQWSAWAGRAGVFPKSPPKRTEAAGN